MQLHTPKIRDKQFLLLTQARLSTQVPKKSNLFTCAPSPKPTCPLKNFTPLITFFSLVYHHHSCVCLHVISLGIPSQGTLSKISPFSQSLFLLTCVIFFHSTNQYQMYVFYLLALCQSSLLQRKPHESLSHSLFYLQHIKQCLVLSRCSINTYNMNVE